MRTRTVLVIAAGIIVLIAFVHALAGGGHVASGGRPESRATLVGRASFLGDLPTTNRGSVRLTVRGVAEDVSDTCRSSGEQAFTATYDGELIVDDNNAFSTSLYPSGVVTTGGCIVSALRVDHIESVMLEAQLGDVQGRGELRFQNLAAVDGDELLAGSFDEVSGDLVFQSRSPLVSQSDD